MHKDVNDTFPMSQSSGKPIAWVEPGPELWAFLDVLCFGWKEPRRLARSKPSNTCPGIDSVKSHMIAHSFFIHQRF